MSYHKMLPKEGELKVRVISGERKGHKLAGPKGSDVRPTEDRVKESFFNIISPIKQGSVVVDLFAGTGGIGIEFLSRGSEYCYFIDKNPESVKLINHNLLHTRLNNKATIINIDSRVALKKIKDKGVLVDYIYIDPPYKESELFHEVLQLIDDLGILSEKGIVVVEHNKKLILDKKFKSLSRYDSRLYGNKAMTYYKIIEVE